MAEVKCPIEGCGESVSKRGLHGHIQHRHGVPQEEALRRAEKAKQDDRDASSEPDASPPDPGTDPGRQAGRDGRETGRDGTDEFGEVSSHVRQRLEETADVAASMRMLRALDDDDGEAEADSDPLADVERTVELLHGLKELTDDGNDGGLTAEEARRIVREEAATQVAADGGATATTDPLVAAVESGTTDPDELAAIAEATGSSGPSWTELGQRALSLVEKSDGLAERLVGVVGEVVAARQAPARQRRQQAVQGRQQAAGSPAEQPDTDNTMTDTNDTATTDDAQSPSEERLARAKADAADGGGDDE